MTLIERIEAARKGEQHDLIVAALFRCWSAAWIDDKTYYRGRELVQAGAYTDAALLLVPDRYSWGLDCTNTMSVAYIYALPHDEDKQIASARAVTPALAIVAADLRAREDKA